MHSNKNYETPHLEVISPFLPSEEVNNEYLAALERLKKSPLLFIKKVRKEED